MPSFTIYLPKEVYAKVLREAIRKNTSVSKVIAARLMEVYGKETVQTA